MDATLAVYKAKEYEPFVFRLFQEKLVDIGYPPELLEYKYDATFAVRGTWFDKRHGNLLKTDDHNNILGAWHGFRKLQGSEIRSFYPNKHLLFDGDRVYVLNTVFNMPETYMLACLVDLFEKSSTFRPTEDGRGFTAGSDVLSFRTIFNDSRRVVDGVHLSDAYKTQLSKEVERFIEKDERAVPFVTRLRETGKKLFLLTNSDFNFTKSLMQFIYGADWKMLFDVVIVDGNKPKWFTVDGLFREVDEQTGKPKLGYHEGPFCSGSVYCGGSVMEFRRRTHLAGKDTLYVGDHIYGDVLHSKKTGGWRTLLIVPELDRELSIWTSQRERFLQIYRIDYHMYHEETTASSESFSDDSMGETSPREDSFVKKRNQAFIKEATTDLEKQYSRMGSLLRCGSRKTWFASQLHKYADLYTCCVYNLMNYGPNESFYSPLTFLPHEVHVQPLSIDSEFNVKPPKLTSSGARTSKSH